MLSNTTMGSVVLAANFSGNVGIGNTSPSWDLHVTGANTTQGMFQSTGANGAHIALQNLGGGNQDDIDLYDATNIKRQFGKDNRSKPRCQLKSPLAQAAHISSSARATAGIGTVCIKVRSAANAMTISLLMIVKRTDLLLHLMGARWNAVHSS